MRAAMSPTRGESLRERESWRPDEPFGRAAIGVASQRPEWDGNFRRPRHHGSGIRGKAGGTNELAAGIGVTFRLSLTAKVGLRHVARRGRAVMNVMAARAVGARLDDVVTGVRRTMNR